MMPKTQNSADHATAGAVGAGRTGRDMELQRC
jgi:hypothetical protein